MSIFATSDVNSNSVSVGTAVIVLEIDETVFEGLDAEACTQLQSMLGEKLVVYEVDPYGRAWVEKWWYEGEKDSTSHSLGLDLHQMKADS